MRAALDDSPVVTLTGVGGVGKTRLALQVAADAVARFPDGAWFVDLGPVLDAELRRRGARARRCCCPSAARARSRSRSSPRCASKRLLVVLDNCEHVVDAVADLVDTVVGSCPGVSVLATSREALGRRRRGHLRGPAAGHAARRMPTAASGSLLDNDAIRLFAERARSAKRGFSLSAENAPVVAEICRRLDGIPLAIELAAARLKMMSPAEVLARLDERFRLLAGGRRTVLERHQTLRGAIDWSYALLEPGRAAPLRPPVGVRRGLHPRGGRGGRRGRGRRGRLTCSRSSGAWSPSRWSSPTTPRPGPATGCSTRCASTRASGSTSSTTRPGCTPATQRTSWPSSRPSRRR